MKIAQTHFSRNALGFVVIIIIIYWLIIIIF